MKRVGIIGMGHVGSDLAYTMMRVGTVDELVLIDKNNKKVQAEALELKDAMACHEVDVSIYLNDYAKLKEAQVVVICVGATCLETSNRMSELEENAASVKEIIPKVIKTGFNGIFLVVSNPCDVITMLVHKYSGFTHKQVFGTGTSLDTMRMRRVVSTKLDVKSKEIEGFVIGEHGESQFVAWSTVKYKQELVRDLPEFSSISLEEVKDEIRDGGWKIFDAKGWTSYGIATASNKIIDSLLKKESFMAPISVFDEKEGVYVGYPAIIDKKGAKKQEDFCLTLDEKKMYHQSATTIKQAYEKIIG